MRLPGPAALPLTVNSSYPAFTLALSETRTPHGCNPCVHLHASPLIHTHRS